jgi:competence protein ComEC
LHLIKTAKDAFLVKEWLAADADERSVDDASLSEGVSCDGEGCVAPMADGTFVALSLQPEGIADDCARAALIVTARPTPRSCSAAVVELDRLRSQGATALRRKGRGFVAEAVNPRGTNRPWSPGAADIETEPGPAVSRTIDATPEAELQTEE